MSTVVQECIFEGWPVIWFGLFITLPSKYIGKFSSQFCARKVNLIAIRQDILNAILSDLQERGLNGERTYEVNFINW